MMVAHVSMLSVNYAIYMCTYIHMYVATYYYECYLQSLTFYAFKYRIAGFCRG